ncbi:MAG: helix-turn-helix transcriptional regulator [Paracoccus sp. (in: a-proteobacteria)]|uniref:helix-turn-helix transcriptional regulator n=1 Tax=Paracoccus sp. TaxID=267 RepID=UPI00391BFF39
MSDLHAYLTQAGIRQDEFATSVGVTQATISKLVRGVARPSLDLAFAISRATNGLVPVVAWDREAIAQPPNQETPHDPSSEDCTDAA